MERIRVLSIDGGGIRGLIPAYFLEQLQSLLEDTPGAGVSSVADLFDVIIGTSTGAIIAAALADGIPPEQIKKLYRGHESASRIFQKPRRCRWFRRTRSFVHDLFSPTYVAEGLESVLQEQFKKRRLRDVKEHRLLVTAFDAQSRRHFVFDSADPQHGDYDLWSVCRASAAAPTYFPGHEETIAGVRTPLLDGGLAANNPAPLGLTRVVEHGATPENIVLVSLGTGYAEEPISIDAAKGRGKATWAKPIIDLLFDGSATVNDKVVRTILPKGNYYRFQVRLEKERMALDRIEESNLESLEIAASTYFGRNDTKERINDALNALGVGAVRPRVWIAGTWGSQFSYNRDPGDPYADEKVDRDRVEITQSGLSIQGKSIEGEYTYEFSGRIENADVIGEWRGLQNKLMGPFHLRLNVDTSQELDGYWIGTGASGLYHGRWTLQRENVE